MLWILHQVLTKLCICHMWTLYHPIFSKHLLERRLLIKVWPSYGQEHDTNGCANVGVCDGQHLDGQILKAARMYLYQTYSRMVVQAKAQVILQQHLLRRLLVLVHHLEIRWLIRLMARDNLIKPGS